MQEKLLYSLKRILEFDLGIKPNQISEDNIWELARKAEALKKGQPLDTYFSAKFLNYSWDIIGLFMFLEQALGIEIFDEEAEATKTLQDLLTLLQKKIALDEIKIHQDYFDSLIMADKIKILIIGRDPYPKGSMGIPFCKDDIKELRKHNCSGKYLLKGLGVDIDSDKREPNEIFFDLLKTKSVGFVNASYFYIGTEKPKRYQVKYSNLVNQQIFKKSEFVIMTNSAEKLLKTRDKKIVTGYNPIDEIEIKMPIKKNWITVCHPDFRNINKECHKKLWNTDSGLFKFIDNGQRKN